MSEEIEFFKAHPKKGGRWLLVERSDESLSVEYESKKEQQREIISVPAFLDGEWPKEAKAELRQVLKRMGRLDL
jgi:hypothetical protein